MRRSLIALGVFIVLYIVLALTAGFWANWFWFDSLGLSQVLLPRVSAPLLVGLAVGLIAGLVTAANLLLVRSRSVPRAFRGQLQPVPPGLTRLIVWLASLAIAVVLGLSAAPRWETALLALNAVPFGVADPLFGMDVGFYVFTLPLMETIRGLLLELLFFVAVAVVGFYVLQTGASLRQGRLHVPESLRLHLSALGIVFLLLTAAGYWADIFELVYSRRGVVVGAGYTDVNAQLLAYRVLLVVAVVAAVGLLVYLVTRRLLILMGSVAVWPLAALLLGVAYPAVIQNLVVRPNELNLEAPYIEHNIRMTRAAFGLDAIQQSSLSGRETLTATDLRASPETITNLRLWDIRPLLESYQQTQEIRLYYSFTDVDVDRYRINGQLRQLMVAARELDQDQLSSQAQTWQNRHLVYTHGFGAVASPVNEQRAEGLPRLFLENIPPTGLPELSLTQPRIYFGEKTSNYVFVRTLPGRPGEEPEFDFPSGDSNATYTYTGRDGVVLDSPLKRLLLAFYFADSNVLFSRNFTGETRALYHRSIQERVGRLAPFLELDQDPYLAIVDGRLIWIMDAYTTTDRYPYSTPAATPALGRLNYIRNPVKITVDAYDGTVAFYVIDEEEPLLRAYRGLYPALFSPLSAAPPGLRQHFRYPEDLFNLQSEVYTTYHMQNPQVFYNREDSWAVPTLGAGPSVAPMAAYYVVMALPESNEVEFMLMRPFTPRGKGNMVAWMVGRSDGDNLGKLRVYTFPKDRVLFGPQQVDARINQDPEISQQISLWDQRGSQVLRGNLLVVPIRETLLYVQPLYLQAENSRLPELTRVIVASSERVAMAEDLPTALAKLVGAPPGSVTTQQPPGQPSPAPAPPLPTSETQRLAQQAQAQYRAAQEALRRGDWAAYGAALKELEATLERLAGGS